MLIFFIMMTIGVLIVVSVSQELCQHALNIVQDFMLSHKSLLLSLHAAMKSSSLLLSAILVDTSPVRTELMVAEEA